MKLLAVCENERFPISVGTGNKDLAWLAQVIAHIVGRKRHPTWNYTPILLKNAAGDVPHPRSRINQVFQQEDEEVHVQVRKENQELDEEQQEWYDRAFGKLRYRMKGKFYYAFEKKAWTDRNPDQKIQSFNVLIRFKRFPETMGDPSSKDARDLEELQMEARFDAKEFTDYYLEKEFPLGEITAELIQVYTVKGDEEVKRKVLGTKEPGFSFDLTPNPISEKQLIELEISEIEKQADIADLKPEKEVEQVQPLGHCPYSIDTLWKIFDWAWLSQDTSQEIVMKFLEGELDKIYEIFFHFSQFHIQDLEVRERIAITWQDVMLVLKFYEILPTGALLRNFLVNYSQETNAYNALEETVMVENPVQFPEFVFVLLRAIHYGKHNATDEFEEGHGSQKALSQNQIQDSVFQTKLVRMLEIHLNDEDLTDFQRHMLFSAPLIELLRDKSPILKQVFIDKLSNTLQPSEHKFYLLKGEIAKIIDDIGFLGENVEQIVDTCFAEITPGEKYHEFEGLYYYEYLQALQWLSLVFIQRKDENIDPTEEDIEVSDDVLIEKLGYFLDKLEGLSPEEEEETE